jgi:endonuclease I
MQSIDYNHVIPYYSPISSSGGKRRHRKNKTHKNKKSKKSRTRRH